MNWLKIVNVLVIFVVMFIWLFNFANATVWSGIVSAGLGWLFGSLLVEMIK